MNKVLAFMVIMLSIGLQAGGSKRNGSSPKMPWMMSPTVLNQSFSDFQSTPGNSPSPKMAAEDWNNFRNNQNLNDLENSFRASTPISSGMQNFILEVAEIRKINGTPLNNTPEIFGTLLAALVAEQAETENQMWQNYMKFFNSQLQSKIQSLNKQAKKMFLAIG